MEKRPATVSEQFADMDSPDFNYNHNLGDACSEAPPDCAHHPNVLVGNCRA